MAIILGSGVVLVSPMGLGDFSVMAFFEMVPYWCCCDAT